MANVNSAFGLRPVRKLTGAPYTGATTAYVAVAGYGTDLFIGDPVVIVAGSAACGDETLKKIQLATAGSTNQITGVIVGFEPAVNNSTTDTIVSLGYGKASTLRKVLVCDDPDMMYAIQENGTASLANVGLNCNLASGSGSTYTHKSGWVLDSSGTSPASDATYQVTIRQILPVANNTPASANAVYLCTINLHTNRLGAVAGI